MAEPEFWLRGPVPGVPPLLQPVAHALLQAREEVAGAAAPLTTGQLWARPGGAASIGFHLRHLAGALDRLLTYARGESLTPHQLAYLKCENDAGEPPADAATLAALVTAGIDRALEQVRATSDTTLHVVRSVGRQMLPATTLGLMFHAAEHTTRHVGQAITTAKIVRGLEGL